MNQKKIKIILYLPLALFFLANLFYYPLPAKAEEVCAWYQAHDCTEQYAKKADLFKGEFKCVGMTKPSDDDPFLVKPYSCCCKTVTSSGINDSMPKLNIPDIDLQIDIPGLNLTKGANILANCEKDEKGNPTRCSFPWIGEYVAGIYKYAIGIVGILAAVVLMIGGIIWITAGGNASRIGEAKAWIAASLSGLVIALCSYTILYYVNPSLVNFNPLGMSIVKEIKEGDQLPYTSGGGTKTITANNSTYDSLLKNAAFRYSLDCTLLKSFMITESSGNKDAVSPMGAIGLMQLMPSTGQGLGYSTGELFNPNKNIDAGAKYINQLKSTACNGKSSNEVCNTSQLIYIIASYNSGPKANQASSYCPGQTWWQCTTNYRYQETRNYVNKVQGNYELLKQNTWGC